MSIAPLHINIEKESINNTAFRRVVYTDQNIQIVLMDIGVNSGIGYETHHSMTQFIRIESGRGYADINRSIYELFDGVAITIPPGSLHNIFNTGQTPLKLYTIYSGSKPDFPPHGIHEVELNSTQ